MKATNGHKVKVEFTGKLEDGTVFGEASRTRPLEFSMGDRHIIRGFAEAVEGMEPGESKEVRVPPEKAFGSFDATKLMTLLRECFPQNEPICAGMQMNVRDGRGGLLPARVESVTDATITLDFNHPLAGQPLMFHIHVLDVR